MTDSANNPLIKLVNACRVLEMEGHGDLTLGHVSYRDEGGRGFWLKRNAIGLGEVTSESDFILLDTDTGELIEGTGGRHSEWPIHAEIYKNRPEINSVAHTHPKATCLFSALNTRLSSLTIESNYFELPIPVFDESSILIKTSDLGRGLAAALGTNNAVIMANHGVTFCGRTIEEMTMYGIWLEAACDAQLKILSSAQLMREPDSQELDERRKQILTDVHVKHSWDYFLRKLDAKFGAGSMSKPFFGPA